MELLDLNEISFDNVQDVEKTEDKTETKVDDTIVVPIVPVVEVTDVIADPVVTDDTVEDESIIGNVIRDFGLEIEDQIEESQEGLTKVVQLAADKLALEKLETLFTEKPELKKFNDYLNAGGKADKFFEVMYPDKDLNNINKEDTGEQKSVILEYYLEQGYNKEKALAKIQKLEDLDELKTEFEDILEIQIPKQEAAKERLLADQEAQRLQELEDATKYWTNVNEKIKTIDKVKGLNIPLVDKDKLFSYMSKPVKDGYSQEHIDSITMQEEDRIILAYLKMKKFNINELIKKEASTQRVTEVLKFKNEKTSPSKTVTNDYSFDFGDVTAGILETK